MPAILPPAIVNTNAERTCPRTAHTAPGSPSMSAGKASFARPRKAVATSAAPRTSGASTGPPRSW